MCLVRKAIKERKARKTILLMDNDRINELVKIRGTEFDRNRKLMDSTLKMMRKEYANGASMNSLATKYGVSDFAVRYNVDDKFRAEHNKKRSKKYADNHSGRTIFPDDRAEYKKDLIRAKKIKVAGLV